jgi:hypothetical protein
VVTMTARRARPRVSEIAARGKVMAVLLIKGLALSLLLPSTPPQHEPLNRRSVLQQTGAAAAALALAPLAANADVRGVNQDVPTDERGVNNLLKSQGFSTMKVPGGFSPLVQYIGTAPPANIDGFKSRERAFGSTLLVRFMYPSGWLVNTPSITENGEAGNIGANNYVKGDSANFAALPLPPGQKLDTLSKEFFKGWLSSQMAGDVFEDVKVKKIKEVTQPDGTQMLKIDFGYTLLTRAGFTVLRQGVAQAQVADGAVVGIVTATTALRYKELAEQLEKMADSFRAYPVKAPAFGAGSPI